MNSFSAVVTILLVFYISVINCFPADEEVVMNKNYLASSSNTLSSANGFHVNLKETNVNGDCVTHLTITGNGLHKMIQYPCNSRPHSVINLNKTLLVGDEWYSDERAVLVRLVDGKCLKEVFQKKDGVYTSSVLPMPEVNCEKVKLKIEILKEQQSHWEEWYNQKHQEAQQTLTQIQSNLMSLQQNLLGGLFSGLPWNPFGFGK